MNQTLLTRLFKSIEGEPNAPLMRIAFSIIEDENFSPYSGHKKTAKSGFLFVPRTRIELARP